MFLTTHNCIVWCSERMACESINVHSFINNIDKKMHKPSINSREMDRQKFGWK